MEVPLSSLFRRALDASSKAFNLPTIQDETQDLIKASIADLTLLRTRLSALSLFSPGTSEQLSDISTRDLVYLFVPFVLAEQENRVRTLDPTERRERIARAQGLLKEFVGNLESYEVVEENERKLSEKRAGSVSDPARRRELKIQQYKKEKDLRIKIEAVRKRRRQTLSLISPSTDFDLIASLLPSPSNSATTSTTSPSSHRQSQPDSDSEDDSDTDDILREASLLLLRLTYTQAQATLESMDQELELLKSMPPVPPPSERATEMDPRRKEKQKEEDMWKLDTPSPVGGPDGKGPLIDTNGKPLRPFTILPAGAASDRARLQSQVFQAGHRLPTMSIDEYLEIEQQRGNMITGGGPASQAKLTTSEQLQLDSEMDGTSFAEERAEEKRAKDESWARYTDDNPKGAGNTMNRG